MIILAIDTAASLCAACVWDSDAGELGRSVLDLGKGHAEHLMAVIGEAMARAGIDYRDMDAIAVSVGPGSFTGVRVGVSAARGLALALKVPAVGVSTLEALVEEALASELHKQHPSYAVVATIDAGRGQVYAAYYSAFATKLHPPEILSVDNAVDLIETIQENVMLTGSAARMLDDTQQSMFSYRIASEARTADIAVYARLAARKLAEDPAIARDRPKPLYLRDADARPQASFALPRVEPS